MKQLTKIVLMLALGLLLCLPLTVGMLQPQPAPIINAGQVSALNLAVFEAVEQTEEKSEEPGDDDDKDDEAGSNIPVWQLVVGGVGALLMLVGLVVVLRRLLVGAPRGRRSW